MKKGYKFEALSFQTNCNITVRGPEHRSKLSKSEASPIMHVVIDPKCHSSNPMRAKQVIVNSIREFVGDDGSKGRLAYDAAASEEASRCRGSRHNAVYQSNPFANLNRKSCMILIELTFKKIHQQNGRIIKDFHGGYLLKSHVLGKISRSGCRLILCGDNFNMKTKLCDPYILICGESPSDVDRAYEIVADCISQHQRTCPCSYS